MLGTIVDYSAEYEQSCCQQPQSSGGYGTTPTISLDDVQLWSHNLIYITRQFNLCQPAAMHTMTPDIASSHFGSEMGNSGGSGMQELAHGSSGFTNVYEPSNDINYYAGSSISNVSTVPQATASPEVSVGHREDGEGGLDEKWVSYQQLLGSVFQNIVNGSLQSASETLLSVTSWLLSQVAELGMCFADPLWNQD
jgi:hypothetical protein